MNSWASPEDYPDVIIHGEKTEECWGQIYGPDENNVYATPGFVVYDVLLNITEAWLRPISQAELDKSVYIGSTRYLNEPELPLED